jgi:hypothetical protein
LHRVDVTALVQGMTIVTRHVKNFAPDDVKLRKLWAGAA